MTPSETDTLLTQLISDDPRDITAVADRARTSDDPTLLVVAALLASTPTDLLARAATAATQTRSRQLVAIATAHLAGDGDRVDALARDHLVDHPDDVLVAWIAGAARTTSPARHDPPIRPHHHRKTP